MSASSSPMTSSSATSSLASASAESSTSESVTSVTTNLDTLPAAAQPVAEAPKAVAEAPAKGEESGGLPQLKTEHWGGQIVWLVVIFAIFYLFIARVFTPKLRNVIEKRGATIAEDLANARAIRDEAQAQAKQAAEETAAAHAAARKLADDAKARATAETAAETAREDAKLQASLSEAEARIRTMRDEAMQHVAEIAEDTASSLVEKLTGKPASKASLTAALRATQPVKV